MNDWHDQYEQAAQPWVDDVGVDRGPLLAVSGSIVAAVLSSACCWIPLLLLLIGANIASIAGFFEQYRWAFIGSAVALLSLGFYLVYFKKTCCDAQPGGSRCRRLRAVNVASLWIGAIAVLAGAAAPEFFADDLLASIEQHVAVGGEVRGASEPTTDVNIQIEGMTCPGCAATIMQAIQSVEGVVEAQVSYDEAAATLRITANTSLSDVLGTIEKLGYHGSLQPDVSPVAASSVSETGVPSS